MLAKRSDQIASLVVNANALLAELLTQRNSVDALMNNLTAVSHQISGLVADNRTQLKPALDKLNGVLEILDNRKTGTAAHAVSASAVRDVVRRGAWGPDRSSRPPWSTSLPASSPSRSSTPRSPTWVWTPTCCCRRNSSIPASGQPGTPALPVPFPRTGQGGEPNLTLPDAITGNPGDRGAARPACRCPAPPAATPTASRCPRRRQAVRRRVRPPSGLRAGELPPPTVAPPNPAAAEGGPPANPADAERGQR